MMHLVSQYLLHLTCRHSSALTRLTWGGFAGPWERVGLLPRPEMKIVTAVCVDQPTEGMVQRLQMSRAARAAREASSDHSRSCILSVRLCACPRSLSLSAPCRMACEISRQVRCLSRGVSNSFATGEQLAASANSGKRDCVCVYDIASGPFESLQPQVGGETKVVRGGA